VQAGQCKLQRDQLPDAAFFDSVAALDQVGISWSATLFALCKHTYDCAVVFSAALHVPFLVRPCCLHVMHVVPRPCWHDRTVTESCKDCNTNGYLWAVDTSTTECLKFVVSRQARAVLVIRGQPDNKDSGAEAG
jgi:hypothetical protein